mmetsp:Transcript_7231/g.16812  ORF Transcript_7231/g.16812 Transcript_7231/m.16812 type:complete len:207 (+) Transcript_7231:226-846(+)
MASGGRVGLVVVVTRSLPSPLRLVLDFVVVHAGGRLVHPARHGECGRHPLPLACHIPTQEVLVLPPQPRVLAFQCTDLLAHTCNLPLQLNIPRPFGREMAQQRLDIPVPDQLISYAEPLPLIVDRLHESSSLLSILSDAEPGKEMRHHADLESQEWSNVELLLSVMNIPNLLPHSIRSTVGRVVNLKKNPSTSFKISHLPLSEGMV